MHEVVVVDLRNGNLQVEPALEIPSDIEPYIDEDGALVEHLPTNTNHCNIKDGELLEPAFRIWRYTAWKRIRL
jgi:hypothetical protein